MDSNDTNSAPANAATSASSTNGPGQALRQARTDLRLNPEDVANQLHLAPRQILALEADDYEHLPQATYVRGYLRSYALFLGLSPEPILDAYNRTIAGRTPAKRMRDRQKPAAPEHEGRSNFGTFAVGGLILVLVAAWWQGREGDDAARDSGVVPANGPPAASGSVPGDTAPATDAPPVSSTPPAASATDPAASAPAPSAATDNAAAPAPTAPASATPAAPASAPTPPVAEESTTPPKPRPLPKNARVARLVLDASAESWVEVRDARGERLLYQTIPAGRVVGLEGMAPFRVFLGNAKGVTVAIDGEAYDASRHRRGATARFTLNPPTATPDAPAQAAPAPEPARDAPARSESNAPPLLPE